MKIVEIDRKALMKTYSLPNLLTNPSIRLVYIINNKQYTFSFRWLSDFCHLSIYQIKDNKQVYLVKGRAITPNTNLIGRVNDNSLISGQLIIKNKYGQDVEISRYNFHTDFEMEYYEQ